MFSSHGDSFIDLGGGSGCLSHFYHDEAISLFQLWDSDFLMSVPFLWGIINLFIMFDAGTQGDAC